MSGREALFDRLFEPLVIADDADARSVGLDAGIAAVERDRRSDRLVAFQTVTPAVVAAIVAAVLARLLIAIAQRRSILAIPNERSSHTVPTPTLGGVSIALVVFAWGGVSDRPGSAVLGGAGRRVHVGSARSDRRSA